MTIALAARLRPIPLLSLFAGLLAAAYVALMVATVLFATLQTQLAQEVQQKHMQIASLERAYYGKVAELEATDPSTLGFVMPKNVRYVSAAPLPNLTFAD